MLVLSLSHANNTSPAAVKTATVFTDDNLALLDVRFKQYRVGDGVEAYIVNDRVYLPLVDVFALLELNISTTADGAAGWFINENYDFSLRQTASGWLATVIGMEVEVPDDEIVQFYDMLYADMQLLEDWFGARLTLNFSQSLLTLSTQQKLPFEKRIERNERVIQKRHLPRAAENPLLINPYKLAEAPSLDLSATHLTRRNEKTKAEKETRTTYSVITHGDLGFMNSELLLSGEREEGVLNASARLQRYDHNGDLLGALGATHIGIGDISSPSIPLAAGGGNGRGIIINNKDLSVNQKSDTRVIDGNYHPGWDVELYQNGIVVGSQLIGGDGRYEFADIPLFLGNNRFTLKFYGPGGKEETEERTLFLGASDDDVGKLKYSASIFQPNIKTLNVNEVNDDRDAYEQAVLSARYGLNPNTSLHAGIVHKDIDSDNAKDFYNIGLQSSIWNTNLLLDMTRDDLGSNTFAFSANQYINRTHLSLGIIEFDQNSQSNRKRQLTFGASGQFFDTPYNLNGYRLTNTDSTEDSVNIGLSGNIERLRWSKSFDYKSLTTQESDIQTIDGNLFLGYSLSPISFRLGLNYHIDPEAEVDSADLSSFFAIDNDTSINISARYRPEDNSTRYNLGLTWKLPYFQLTPSVSYDDSGEVTGLVTVSASLGKRSSAQGLYYNLNSTRQANQGTFKARLFEDVNSNGFYEFGEPLLEGGEISAQQSHRKGRSDEEGITWLERITAWQQTDIAYEPGSIEAAPMVYTGKPFSVVMRPGSVTAVNMPFVRTGEIDGTIHRKTGSFTSPARGIRLSLVDDKDGTIEQTTTDAYGFFLLEDIRPGNYRLKAMNEAWLIPADAQFNIASDGTAILDKKLLLGPAPKLPPKRPISLLDIQKSSASTVRQTTSTSLPLLTRQVEPTAEFWSLQVASYRKPTNAHRLEERLRQQGYNAFSRNAVIDERRFIRVYAGQKINRQQVLKIKTDIDQLLNVHAMAVKLEQESVTR